MGASVRANKSLNYVTCRFPAMACMRMYEQTHVGACEAQHVASRPLESLKFMKLIALRVHTGTGGVALTHVFKESSIFMHERGCAHAHLKRYVCACANLRGHLLRFACGAGRVRMDPSNLEINRRMGVAAHVRRQGAQRHIYKCEEEQQ